jgi:hypothetical protein
MTERSIGEVLNAAADLLDKPGAWTQGNSGRDAHGAEVPWNDPDAVCWCAFGAVWKSQGRMTVQNTPAEDILERIVGWDITAWNDSPDRTQAEVVSALRAASRLATEGEVG